MKWLVAAVGQKQPAWVDVAFNDYAQRFPADQPLILKEIKAAPRTTGKTVDEIKRLEAERLDQALGKDVLRIALDERGKLLTTKAFADFLATIRDQRPGDIAFVIGGPDGLDEGFKKACAHQIQLSALTLPHGLARVLLAEQLYRAWSLSSGHPYHRE